MERKRNHEAERNFRRKLKFHFMNPFQKWKYAKRRRFPFKLVLQLLAVALVTAQVCVRTCMHVCVCARVCACVRVCVSCFDSVCQSVVDLPSLLMLYRSFGLEIRSPLRLGSS